MRFLPILVVLFIALPARAEKPVARGPQSNPLLSEWKTPFEVPPFDQIKAEHFVPAYKEAIARHAAEVQAIAKNRQAPTFANTIEALDLSGELLSRVGAVFGNLNATETNDTMQGIAIETAPMLSAHQDDINLNEVLFKRVKAVWDARDRLKLDPDQAKLLDDTYRGFVRGGALLTGPQKERFRAINAELATLTVKFGDNVLKQTNAYRLVIDRPEDLAGLPERVVAGAAETARKAGLEGKWLFTLQWPSIEPFLQYADNRELRKQIFQAYITRCDHNDEFDNKRILSRIAALRAERAKLLGFDTYAAFVLDRNMAKTPDRVYHLLDQVWTPAKAVAAREAADQQAIIKAEGKDFALEPWDWWYYTEKVRKSRYNIDEQAVRQYFPLDQVRRGAFHVANRLYGITFTELKDVPVYNPEVKVFEVKDRDGSHLAVYYVDYHPRASKRSGAWSSGFRDTWVEKGKSIRPVVTNCGNFSRPAGDAPALLSLDEVTTLFHEFGHGLHAILSRVRYRGLGDTPRDFVELPSQIMEKWALEPEVLKFYAKHWRTGEPMPPELVEKIQQADKFNQGFATVEYVAASYLDMAWHTLSAPVALDATEFEDNTLSRIGEPREIVTRYRSPYFRHIFSGGYAAGYYSYLWSDMLVEDAFQLFKEKGIFDPATALSFRKNILEPGGGEDALALYLRFRGREPSVEPLLEKRGLK